jgi:nucleoside-diphosphate-sugar epimerase
MRVLVIGGTNFIGPRVVTSLSQTGHDVTVFHRGIHEPSPPSVVRHIHSPLANLPILELPSELTQQRFDLLLHMVPIGADDTQAAIESFRGKVDRMVVLSSGDVYQAYGRLLGNEAGAAVPTPLDEDAPLRTTYFPYRHAAAGPEDWTYYYEKIFVERAVLSATGLAGTVLRLPAVYGPGDPHLRLRPYIRRMDDHRPGILMETAYATWRWTHGYVEEVARAIVLAVKSPRAAGRVYNVGEQGTPTMMERVRRLGELAGWSGKIIALPSRRMPAHLLAPFEPTHDLVMDTTRIRSELGFSEQLSGNEGLERTIEWERSNASQPGDPGAAEYAAEDIALSGAVG